MADPVTIEDIYELFRRSQAEADERFRRSQAEADRRAAEADRRAAEADQRLNRLEQIAADNSFDMAGLTTHWDQFMDNLVGPAMVRLFQERGIEVQETSRRLKSQRPGAALEIDILAVNGDVAVAIEVKSRLSRQDVEDFLARLPKFKQAFPQYGAYYIHGAVAGIEIDEGVDRYAYQQGLFVIKQTGDTVTLANDLKFQPTAW